MATYEVCHEPLEFDASDVFNRAAYQEMLAVWQGVYSYDEDWGEVADKLVGIADENELSTEISGGIGKRSLKDAYELEHCEIPEDW